MTRWMPGSAKAASERPHPTPDHATMLWPCGPKHGPRKLWGERAGHPTTGLALRRPSAGFVTADDISARNESSFRARAIYDDRCFRPCSVLVDLVALLRTVSVILSTGGGGNAKDRLFRGGGIGGGICTQTERHGIKAI